MNRKTAVSLVMVVGLAGTVAAWEVGRRSGDTANVGQAIGDNVRPNILIIVADDLGVDKVGAYTIDVDDTYAEEATALPQTPVLDSMAQAGVRFTDGWANPACSPTRATVLTGTWALRHGVGEALGREGSQPLDTDETTLAHVASDANYATGLFGKWHLGEGELPGSWADDESWEEHLGEMVPVDFPTILVGFDAFRGVRSDLEVGYWEGYYDFMTLTSVNRVGSFTVPTAETEYATTATTQAALGWINDQTGPWLASVNYHAPHTPFQLPPSDCGYGDASDLRDALTHKAMVECLDQEIGVLLDGVATLANTVVLFIGDNGTEDRVAQGPFDDERGKGTLYESGIRVPVIAVDGADWMISQGKGTAALTRRSLGVVENPGREVSDLVSVVDLYATVREITGSATGGGEDSVSLMPFLRDTDGTIREFIYSELYSTDSGTAAYRDDDAKLIVWARNQGGEFCRARYELYNVWEDRFEQNDLAPSQPDAVEDMKQKLDALVSSAPGSWLDVPDC